MTHDNAPRREDARHLQSKLYREIGISAVAAALHFTTQPDPAPRAAAVPMDKPVAKPQVTAARAA